jgi:hypothetical protein
MKKMNRRMYIKSSVMATGSFALAALPLEKVLPEKNRTMTRLMIDDDGSNFIGNLSEDIEQSVADAIRDCPSEVTTYLLCSAAGTCIYPTTVGCVAPDAAAIHKMGFDPFGMLLRGLKASGKETFITYRMNDVHNATDSNQWNTPRIRREHPDFVVGIDEIKAGKAVWMSYCLDYTLPEVRRYVLDIISEQVDLYGDVLDGFQLDWMRFPRHMSGSPDEVWNKREIITGFIGQVRQILKRMGQNKLLSVRVPTTPEACRRLGFDLAAWGKLHLVDIVVPCPFLTTEWLMPVGEMRTWLDNPEISIIGGFDMGFGWQVHFPESLRGISSTLYDCGSDGVYLFNFPCWIEYLASRPYHWLSGLGNPQTASAKPLLLAVEHSQYKMDGIDQPGQLPTALPSKGRLELTIYVPRTALPAWRALILVHSHGDIALSVNDSEAKAVHFNKGQRYALFVEITLPEYQPPEGIIKQEDCRVFRLNDQALTPGINRLRLQNLTDQALMIERVNLGLW